jgi:hypothetical protein
VTDSDYMQVSTQVSAEPKVVFSHSPTQLVTSSPSARNRAFPLCSALRVDVLRCNMGRVHRAGWLRWRSGCSVI